MPFLPTDDGVTEDAKLFDLGLDHLRVAIDEYGSERMVSMLTGLDRHIDGNS